jgi:hypothetical protein
MLLEARMKRLLAAVVVAVVMVPGVAHGSHGQDYMKGRFTVSIFDIDMSATSNFNGTNPSGRVRVTLSDSDPNVVITAEVRCLSVVGINGTLTADVTRVQGGTTFINSITIFATDTGKFSGLPDTQSLILSSAFANPACIAAPGSGPANGDIVIHDS